MVGRIARVEMQLRRPWIRGNDLIECGKVKAIADQGGERILTLEIWADDEHGEKLAVGTAEVDLLTGFEEALLTGGASDNVLDARAFPRKVTLKGLGGNDQLFGGDYDDVLEGGSGDDQLRAPEDAAQEEVRARQPPGDGDLGPVEHDPVGPGEVRPYTRNRRHALYKVR